MTIKAVVFDFDGVIVHSEPLHWRAYQRVLTPEGLGFSWERYLSEYIGFDDREVFLRILESAGRPTGAEEVAELIRRKADAFLVEIRLDFPVVYPGVMRLIRELKASGPIAICTGALPSDLDPILKRLDLAGQFDTIVTAADVPVSKPDPAPYRLTMERLAAQTGRPVRGVAVEDSPAGIQAAHEAGLKVLAVTHTHPASELFAADRIIDNFESLPSGEVLALIGGAS